MRSEGKLTCHGDEGEKARGQIISKGSRGGVQKSPGNIAIQGEPGSKSTCKVKNKIAVANSGRRKSRRRSSSQRETRQESRTTRKNTTSVGSQQVRAPPLTEAHREDWAEKRKKKPLG